VLEHHKINATVVDRWRPFSIAAARTTARGLPSLYTLDIMVDRTMDAYLALGLLHRLYAPIPGKLRDHLNAPSQFGYQALKTTCRLANCGCGWKSPRASWHASTRRGTGPGF